eukprot:GFUD01043394.1.p1 GENE.GFUD01043394.1~~GFUD01043394.1.p1  ORF type:complete len:215 (+),score=43.03 GFUD01043394.1:163-807(+)
MSKFYLLAYNSAQAVGWSYMLLKMGSHFALGGATDTLYDGVKMSLQVFQTLAMLELVHAMLGLVRSSVQVTMQQLFARMYITWAILYSLPPAQLSLGFPILLFAWTVTEVIRYSMYAVSLVTSPPFFLVWLRYTFFIIAYPMGLVGELMVSYSGRTYAEEHDIFAVKLPNKLNITFHFPSVILVFMVLYIIFFNPMYIHMFGQRKKVLGGKKEE